MNTETTRPATSFYLDCAIAVTSGIAGAAWSISQGGVLAPIFISIAAFYAAVIVLGLLHRFGMSPGQLVFGRERPGTGRSVATHVIMFGGGVTMTLIFAFGCGLVALVKPQRRAA